ncbi:hypothetical protein QQS21_009995 [Conoideocrella luteorostrata]|uniref:Protein NO VEIN C-terminal domain-containing protein n=1 Tax=Conoideocrella luteorostrata TaxID=1105319 RepID=A0AAJ0FXA7_9HYPO|nr:hypothetical protein QQS21_009995 [Conoideocrella luteorostrata]
MTTPEEAKAIVQRLTDVYGILDRDMMDHIGSWIPEYRDNIDKNWLALETTAANSVKTLANHIYGSGARFVFELLQNADDNKFSRAIANGAEPSITFEVFDDRIVVECNEDGFKERDLEAICAVGKSTKAASGSGYIGNKGIGFKSVFIAASTVYIQSGNYSFQFHHKKTDPGLGMVRPEWKEAKEQLRGPLTRMILYLHNEGNSDDREHQRSIIRNQLDELQETCLLFLKQLKRIGVKFFDKNGKPEKSKQFSKHVIDDYRVSLRITSSDKDGNKREESHLYHITRNNATGLKQGANRDIPEISANEKELAKTAEIVLAFPLTKHLKPITSKRQYVFAFLPVRMLDYTFLIHTDFDTNASREDIVTTSERNRSLIEWIAKTFVQAVLEFCEHTSLRYEWPAFLPSTEVENSTSSFWLMLNKGIADRINKVPVFMSRGESDLRMLNKIFLPTAGTQLADGTPVLDDKDNNLFLSPKYAPDIVQTLKAYGLKELGISIVIDLLEEDIDATDSKLRNGATSEEWHTVIAKFLCKHLYEGSKHQSRLENLDLIPLRDGRWVSALSRKVYPYFPETNGIEIPNAVKMDIVRSTAVLNPHRKALFEKLEVSEASIDMVRYKIFSEFTSPSKSPQHWVSCVKYLDYLYRTSKPPSKRYPDKPAEEFGKVVLIDHTGKRRGPCKDDIYLPGQSYPHSPESYLSGGGAATGPSVLFIHPSYMCYPPDKPSSEHLPWNAWLCKSVGVRERLRLLERGNKNLSDTSLYVLECQPQKFLGLVLHLWEYEGSQVKASQSLQRLFGDLTAKDLCEGNISVKLRDTWLPLPILLEKVEWYMEQLNQFPFLKFDPSETKADEFGVKWAFMHKYFGVGMEESITFLLEILRHIQSSYSLPTISQTQRIFDLYEAIYSKLIAAKHKTVEEEKVKKYFSEAGILVPDDENTSWSKSSDCLWLAPPNLTTKHSLRTLYARTLGKEHLNNIEKLFARVGMIPAASSSDLVTELRALKAIRCTDFDRIKGLYKFLSALEENGPGILDAFNNNALIYAKKHDQWDWYKTTGCLWSSTTSIRGKVTLDADYEELKPFFVDILGVKLLTIQLVYDELRQTKSEQNITELKTTISVFSSLLETEQRFSFDPKPIREASIFPVRYCDGAAVLRSADTEFAIGDRDYLREKFKDRISLLDFDLEEVRRLKAFFEYLGLTYRYLSNCVEEYTSVSDHSGRLIESGPHNLKRKAYYILRVAATFGSIRYRIDSPGLYQSLCAIKVKETDGIFTSLSIQQNNKQIFTEEIAGSEHIYETAEEVIIYVPKRRKAQDICFYSVLPHKFAEWLMRSPTTNRLEGPVDDEAVQSLAAVFACRRLALDEILDRQGIIQVAIENQDPEESEESEEDDDYQVDENEAIEQNLEHGAGQAEEDNVESAGARHEEQRDWRSEAGNERRDTLTGLSIDSYNADNTGISDLESGESNTETLVETVTRQSHMSSSPRPVVHLRSPRQSLGSVSNSLEQIASPRMADVAIGNTGDARYSNLLNRVVAAAQQATFPSQGTFDLSSLSEALPGYTPTDGVESFDGLEVYAGFRSAGQLERDMKVGAAGELYVFELLSRIGLPNWSRDNWQSKIRTYARAHSAYATIDAWPHSETSDLVYDDTEGHFTDMLIGCGYLDEDEWHGARPKYFLEVKTTTGPRETPFYVSGNQYRLIEQKHRLEDRSEVYIILRVFWLTSEKITMSVLLDPWQLKQDQWLLFKGQSWVVTPGTGPSRST